MSQPAQAIVTALTSALSGETVVAGLPQDDPDRGVWVSPTGGFPPIAETGGASGVNIERPRVRVFCRVTQRTRNELDALVESARNALQRTAPSGYSRIDVHRETELQPDARGRHMSVFIVDLVVRE